MDGGRPQQDDILDGYRLIRPLGAGGFGEVWLCRSEAVGDDHALKFVRASDARLLEKEFEALVLYRRTVARAGSPHLVPIEHINRNGDGLYYIMPLADGVTPGDPAEPSWKPRTLAECIGLQAAGSSWFSAEEVVAMFGPILDGLQLLSDAGLVHRDVKPDNILFLDGRPCLGDVSLLRTDSISATRIGTHGYTAPSWYVGGHPDMYGAAATLYTLITGHPPDCLGRSAFRWPKLDQGMIAEADRQRWKDFHAIIHRAMDEKPSERFPDFNAMARALRETRSPVATAASPPPLPVPSAQPAVREPPALPPARSTSPQADRKFRPAARVLAAIAGGLGLLFVGLLALGSMAQDDQAGKPTENPVANPTPSPTEEPAASPAETPPAAAVAEIRFEPPMVDRSPRDHGKANSIMEDSRLAYNSLAWFMANSGLLTSAERKKLDETLQRIDVLIQDPDDSDLKAAAGLVDASMQAIPALRRSRNAKLAKTLLLHLGGEHGAAGEAESDPDLRTIGDDDLGYRVELMGRLRMDVRVLLDTIITSPDTPTRELVPALMERARVKGSYGDHAGGRQDVLSALQVSTADPQMRAWVENEVENLKRDDGRFARELRSLPKK